MRTAALLALLTAGLLCVGCSSYAWQVFKWNCLSPTPYMSAPQEPNPRAWRSERATLSWIGQSTVLMNLYGTTVLTDPVLVKRIAPIHVGGHLNLGIRRITQLPVKFSDLPPIDCILLSHAHYDHWDLATLKYFGKETTVVIPVGTAGLVPRRRYREVVELAWKEKTKVGPVTIAAFEVEHSGQRGREDTSRRRCNGYVISCDGIRIAFFGDTAFRERKPWPYHRKVDWAKRVAQTPIDVCILPIGAYTYRYNHMSPEEAWRTYKQIGGRWFLPIHWRTFIQAPLEEEPIWEPIERLRKVAGAEIDAIECDEPGATFVVPEKAEQSYRR